MAVWLKKCQGCKHNGVCPFQENGDAQGCEGEPK